MAIKRYNQLAERPRMARYAAALAFGLAIIVRLQVVSAKDALLFELQKIQASEGLSVVWNDREKSGVFFFKDKSVHQTQVLPSGVLGDEVRLSGDGEQVAFALFEKASGSLSVLAIANTDGTNIRKFPAITQPSLICWSPGKDRLALWASKSDSGEGSKTSGLWTLRLDTGESTLIDAHGSVYCPAWSPDGTKVVYSANGTASIYDTNTKNSRRLAEGDYPTWSPDGKWIALSKEKAYWLLDSETGKVKVFFKQKSALTPLWWSPDSQYVAYITRVGFSLSVEEQADLWVRRLQDGAQEKLERVPWTPGIRGFQWVRSLPLLSRAKSAG